MSKLYDEVLGVIRLLKEREREKWSNIETQKINERGEQDADFYRIWYKLCWLDRLLKWVEKYEYFTNSQKRILKEYKRSI